MNGSKVRIGACILGYTYLIFIIITLADASPAPLSTAASQLRAATPTMTRYDAATVDYPIPHSNIILEIGPYSYDPAQPPRIMTREIVLNVLERAFRELLRRAHAHGGVDEYIAHDFEFEALGLMVDVFPHEEARYQRPTYADVGTVLQGLKVGIGLTHWKESLVGIFRKRIGGGKGEEFAVVVVKIATNLNEV
ncbi:MAG: hypothetical protein LQ351_006545 [Letrouitia transgressa]|nr:MAG: hypothetical protein LQ351_006545 [Letrouitia transgressa]